jgi:hypothetical protein
LWSAWSTVLSIFARADLISMDFGRIAGWGTPQARSALRYDDYSFWRAAAGVTIAWTR